MQRARVKEYSDFVHGRSALYEDASLFVVPGSHATPRTAEQRAHSSTLEAPEDPLAMPGSIQLTLKRKFSLITFADRARMTAIIL